MSGELIRQVAQEAVEHGGNQGSKHLRAVRFLIQQRHGVDFQTLADAFAIYASWEGHRVIVDGEQRIPPTVHGGLQ